jgi:hypothetical protein
MTTERYRPIGGYAFISDCHVGDSLVLETTFRSSSGEARLVDCFTMREGGSRYPYRQLLRGAGGPGGLPGRQVRIGNAAAWPGAGTNGAALPTTTTGGSCSSWSTRPPSAGRSPTGGCGSCAASRGTSSTPRRGAKPPLGQGP